MEKSDNESKSKSNIIDFMNVKQSEKYENDINESFQITLANINSYNVFSQKSKIFELKKSFKKSLYDKRIAYGTLCKMNLVNQNLRLTRKYLLDDVDEDIKHDKDDLMNLQLNENQQDLEIDNDNDKDKFLNSTDLKLNLNENFRNEIEKIFYDCNLNLNPRPAKREIKLLKMLKEKIKKYNSLE